MRVVIIGATGNVGTSLLHSLSGQGEVDSVLGIARRLPHIQVAKTEWATADVASDDLVPLFRGADAVVHLAWLIQPSRDQRLLWSVNVEGSARVFRSVADAGVPALVYASSVGTYSPGPKDRRVDESWPTDGVPTSFYARHKAEVERLLDKFELEHAHIRVVRLRPGLIFKREAASGIRRLFGGPLLPSALVAPTRLPFVPDIRGLRFQAAHSLDVGQAYAQAVRSDVRGAFNIAAEPVLDPAVLADLLEARPVRIAPGLVGAAAALSYRLRLQPSERGWLDMALQIPIMDTDRARSELGWKPAHSAGDALRELLAGMAEHAGLRTPPLDPRGGGP